MYTLKITHLINNVNCRNFIKYMKSYKLTFLCHIKSWAIKGNAKTRIRGDEMKFIRRATKYIDLR